MKKIFIILIFLMFFYIYAYSILEINGEIFLEQKNTISKILLNQSSWGIKVYPDDIIETKSNSSCKIGNDESYIEIKNNSNIEIEKDKIFLNHGNFFIENFPTVIMYKGYKINTFKGICEIVNNKLNVLSGEIGINTHLLTSGSVFDFSNGNISHEKKTKKMESEVLPPSTNQKLLSDEEINNINQKAMEMAQKGLIEDAIALLKNGLKKAPKEVSFLNNLGVLYHQLGKYDVAMDYYKHVLILKPDNKLAYYNIVCLYSKKKDKINTLLWYNRERNIFKKDFKNEAIKDPDLEFLRQLTDDFKK